MPEQPIDLELVPGRTLRIHPREAHGLITSGRAKIAGSTSRKRYERWLHRQKQREGEIRMYQPRGAGE